MIVETLGSVFISVLDKIFPDTASIKKADLELKKAAIEAELQVRVAQYGLLQKQAETNTAEAANPNRKWATWRECVGYILVIAIGYQWVMLPLITMIAQAIGHPVNMTQVYTVDILDVLYLLCGMLGLDTAPILANRFKKGVK